METRRGRGEISRQNARAQQMRILICLFLKRGAAGGGVACPPDWRDATRTEEGGARWLKEKAEQSTCEREEALESVGV